MATKNSKTDKMTKTGKSIAPVDRDALEANIGLSTKTRAAVAAILNQTLADIVVLYLKTRNFHWNVEGPQFMELHTLFEGQYEQLDDEMDAVAERARALDHYAHSSLAKMAGLTRLNDTQGGGLSSVEMLAHLYVDHETVIRNLRDDSSKVGALGDAGTEDFLVGIMEAHEKTAWMLRAYSR